MPENNPKVKPVLNLPVPHRINGDVNSMLESTILERFTSIMLVKKADVEAKNATPVLTHKPSKDGKSQVADVNEGLGHLSRFVFALTDAIMSSMGMSGDGSTIYVAKHQADVFKVIPALKEYDLYLQPLSRGGCAKYRIPVQEAVTQVVNRSKWILTSKDKYGILAGKERTSKKSSEAPPVTVEF